jgi:hypothetical protein
MVILNEILSKLSSEKFSLENEKLTQREINAKLTEWGINFKSEYDLDEKNCIDFYFPDFKAGIEVKIGGNHTKNNIYRQVKRYCNFDDISTIIVFTNKSMGLPPTINNKKTHILSLGKAWL